MHIDPEMSVGEFATKHPATYSYFERNRIDYCCGGKRTLVSASTKAQKSWDTFAQELSSAAETEPPCERTEWATAPLETLVAHIVATYHATCREQMERLSPLAAKVYRVHGDAHPELARVDAITKQLSAELTEHMMKEERVLFPMIIGLEQSSTEREVSRVRGPIHVMNLEHEGAGEMLEELRNITSGFVPPTSACGSYRALYYGLEEFEHALHVHVHLESNILFPRALTLLS